MLFTRKIQAVARIAGTQLAIPLHSHSKGMEGNHMEPFTLALTSGYLGNLGAALSQNILSEAGRGIRRAISGDDMNRAFNRCVQAGVVAVAQSTASQEPERTELLKDILDQFFREPDVGGELSEILNSREPNRGELIRLFKDAGYDPETLPGVQFDLAINSFAAAFLSAATLEPLLQPVIQTKQLVEQTRIQQELLDTMKALAAFLKESKPDTIGIQVGAIIAENVVNGQQHRFPSGSGKEPSRSKKIHIEHSNVGMVGDNAKVEGGIHFDNSKTTFSVNADKIEGLSQAERIDKLEQNFGIPKKKE